MVGKWSDKKSPCTPAVRANHRVLGRSHIECSSHFLYFHITLFPALLPTSYSVSTAGRTSVDHKTARNIFTWTIPLSFSHWLMHKVFSIKFCIGFFYCHLLHLFSFLFWLLRFFLSLRLKVLCGGFWLFWMYFSSKSEILKVAQMSCLTGGCM